MAIPSVQSLKEQIISDYESEAGSSASVLPVAFVRIFATVMAGLLHLCYRFGAWTLRQIFAATADSAQLELIGSQYRIFRTAPVAAIVSCSATGVPGERIPAEKTYQIDGVVYAVVAQVEIDGSGEALIDLRCLEPGVIGNRTEGDELTAVVPVEEIDNEVIVIETTVSGADEETTEEYRDRVILRQRTPPQGGAIPDWVAWALEVPGVLKALAWRTAPGEVTVYTVVGTTYGDRMPNEAKMLEIEAYLADPVRCPLNCENVAAGTFSEVEFDFTITDLVPDTSELRDAIEEAIEEYVLDRFPRQYPVLREPKDYVSKLDVYALAKLAGAASMNVTIDVLYGDSDIDVYQLGEDELARTGSITYA